MKTIIRTSCLTILVLLSALSLLAQDRGTPAAASTGAASGAGASISTPSHSVAGGYSSSSASYSAPSRDFGGTPSFGGGGGGMMVNTAPPIPFGSSFNNANYYQFLGFYSWLQANYGWMQMMQYGVWDMSRFYRNCEPLVTPPMLKMTLRAPVRLSERMIAAVDTLQTMLGDRQAGKPVGKDQIEAKTQEIRDLAKAIRHDQAISYFDLRKSRDIAKGFDNLGLGAITQLREMAMELNSQLKSMYNQTITSTVSVNTLSASSFESLSKGIEKLSKIIENAKPRS